MIYIKKQDIQAEAVNRSLLRSRGLGLPDHLAIDTDTDGYLKTAADEIYWKLQSLLTDYEYDQEKIAYRMKEKIETGRMQVMVTLVSNYLTEGILKGWYEDNGYMEGYAQSHQKQELQMEKLQSYRIHPVKLKYNAL